MRISKTKKAIIRHGHIEYVSKYKRTSNIMDALLGNKKVVFLIKEGDYKNSESFPSEENALINDREFNYEMYEKAKSVLEDLALRGIISYKEAYSFLGRYWNNSYIFSGQVIKEFSLYEICCNWSKLGTYAYDSLKYKHYYEERGVSMSMFKAFKRDILHSETGEVAATVLLKYKAKLARKTDKNNTSLNKVHLNINAKKKIKLYGRRSNRPNQ